MASTQEKIACEIPTSVHSPASFSRDVEKFKKKNQMKFVSERVTAISPNPSGTGNLGLRPREDRADLPFFFLSSFVPGRLARKKFFGFPEDGLPIKMGDPGAYSCKRYKYDGDAFLRVPRPNNASAAGATMGHVGGSYWILWVHAAIRLGALPVDGEQPEIFHGPGLRALHAVLAETVFPAFDLPVLAQCGNFCRCARLVAGCSTGGTPKTVVCGS